jgi:RNA polymerase sigma-70 factor (ECF subfamily)
VQPAAVNSAVERDADLIELLRAGQREAAFALLTDRYAQKLYRLCCALLKNAADAEDVTQEALVRIWKALPRYDQRAALSTWIYTIARNRCYTAIERRRQTESMSDDAVALAAEMESAVTPDVDQDHLLLLRELVRELPDRYRQSLELYYYEDRSVEEVGAMLSMPAGTIKTNLHRGRGLLATRLQQLGLADATLWLEAAK